MRLKVWKKAIEFVRVQFTSLLGVFYVKVVLYYDYIVETLHVIIDTLCVIIGRIIHLKASYNSIYIFLFLNY